MNEYSYFPNWLYGRYTPSMIDFSKYTHVVSLFLFTYAFLIPLINVHFSTMLSPSKTLLLLLLGLIPAYLMVSANAKLIWDGLFTHTHTRTQTTFNTVSPSLSLWLTLLVPRSWYLLVDGADRPNSPLWQPLLPTVLLGLSGTLTLSPSTVLMVLILVSFAAVLDLSVNNREYFCRLGIPHCQGCWL